VQWADGFRLRSGSIVVSPPLGYCIRERRLVLLPREEIHEVAEVTLFVVTTDPGLTATLSGPHAASEKTWPALQRWDRAANVLNALEAELQATLLQTMHTE
jgi:hypothetical protein